MGSPPIEQMTDDQLVAEWDATRGQLMLLEREVRRRFIALRGFKARMAREHALATGPTPVREVNEGSARLATGSASLLPETAATLARIADGVDRITAGKTVAVEGIHVVGVERPDPDNFRRGVAAIRQLGARG